MILSPNEIAWIALKYWPNKTDARVAIAIAIAESQLNSEVIARSNTGSHIGNRDHGLWQISNKFHGDKLAVNPDWRYPLVNGKIAKAVYDQQGWQAWAVFNSGSYANYLPDAALSQVHWPMSSLSETHCCQS